MHLQTKPQLNIIELNPIFLKNLLSKFFKRDVIFITLLVFGFMKMGSMIPINFKALNPFKKALSDYDVTDLIFSEFKDKNAHFDDRIVLVNVGKPDRTEISEMINVIQKYEPKVLGLDIHFEDFHQNIQDSLLRKTLKNYPNIITAKRLGNYGESDEEYTGLVGCHAFFCDSLAVAYTNFYASPGNTIRQFSPYESIKGQDVYSLGTALAIAYDPSVKKRLENRKTDSEIINYIGGDDSFITVDKLMLLGEEADMQETFHNKIVILGYLGSDEWAESIKDKFFTPLNDKITSKSIPDMFGLTIHGNICHMLISNDMINIVSPKWKLFLNILLIFLLAHVFNTVYVRINPGYWKIIKVLQLVLFAFLFLIVSMVFYFFNVKLEMGVGIVGAVLSWDAVKFYQNIYIKRQGIFKPKNQTK